MYKRKKKLLNKIMKNYVFSKNQNQNIHNIFNIFIEKTHGNIYILRRALPVCISVAIMLTAILFSNEEIFRRT